MTIPTTYLAALRDLRDTIAELSAELEQEAYPSRRQATHAEWTAAQEALHRLERLRPPGDATHTARLEDNSVQQAS